MRYRSSLRTSYKKGSFAEALGADRRPKSDAANAFAAAHARNRPPSSPRSLHAALQQHWRTLGLVLADHRPPTSPAKTTSRAFLPPSRNFECCTWSGRRTCPGSPITTQCADQCHIDGDLGALEHGQPNDFQPSGETSPSLVP